MEVKCPTVGHENRPFTPVNGWLPKIPMANPPIRASGLGGGLGSWVVVEVGISERLNYFHPV
jgi:hypothetical protein